MQYMATDEIKLRNKNDHFFKNYFHESLCWNALSIVGDIPVRV